MQPTPPQQLAGPRCGFRFHLIVSLVQKQSVHLFETLVLKHQSSDETDLWLTSLILGMPARTISTDGHVAAKNASALSMGGGGLTFAISEATCCGCCKLSPSPFCCRLGSRCSSCAIAQFSRGLWPVDLFLGTRKIDRNFRA